MRIIIAKSRTIVVESKIIMVKGRIIIVKGGILIYKVRRDFWYKVFAPDLVDYSPIIIYAPFNSDQNLL